MQLTNPSRRKSIKQLAALPFVSMAVAKSSCPSEKSSENVNAENKTFHICLNTSTIMGQKIGLVKELETAAEAGYDGIEIWIPTLQKYLSDGGTLADLKKRKDDLGIKIENAIGFAQWVVDDNDIRMNALTQARKEMDMLAAIDCSRIAAPPAGAQNSGKLDLYKVAERFRALVEVGKETGCMPQLEVWGFSKNLSRLSEVLFVAAECGHPDTRILPDAYHLFKGGSDFDGLKLLHPQAVEIFHINDYPKEPSREEMGDKDRVLPGDGVAPMNDILQSLAHKDYPTILSLELFNRELWKQDPLDVAKKGLEKIKACVTAAGFKV